MKITKNFSLNEFESRDGFPMSKEITDNIIELANNLQVIRDYIGQPIFINSAYRSVAHNKRIGGVSNSQHVLGKASDITVKNISPKRLYRIINRLIKKGLIKQGGLGLYRGFVHYDIRGTKARWNNSKK